MATTPPALTLALKLQRRASTVGFDWPDASGPRAKISEELAECDAAVANPDHLAAEIGDLLFSVVNWARHMQIDPETVLRSANARFISRFKCVETLADGPLVDLSLAELEQLWQRAKAIEREG
ncbi:MAG: MazG nucleotide pyrophosphohydrolase domain-containing protein [Pseudomonadota bacterium]